MAPADPKSYDEDLDAASVEDLYSIQDIHKVLEYATLEELRNVGLKEDVPVSYIRIFFFLVLCSIGGYSTAFLKMEKHKQRLQIATAVYFVIWGFLFIYERVILKGANYRFYSHDKLVYIWCRSVATAGNFRLYYTWDDFYEMPLAEMFYDDGQLDREALKGHVKKFAKIVATA